MGRRRRTESSPTPPPAAAQAGTPQRPRTVTIIDEALTDSVVLGGFDDTDDVLGGPPPARTAMDPRIRERRSEVRRRSSRKRRRVLVGVGSLVVLCAVAVVLLVSPVWSVRRVDVDGAVYMQRFDGERLDAVVSSLRGSPMLSVDLAGARGELEASAWVRSVRITRDMPSRVVIEIAERVPLAWFAGPDGRFRVIDSDGAVIAVLEGQPVDYVGIAGLAPDLEPGEMVPPVFRAAAQLSRSLPEEVAARVTGLAVSAEGEVSMTLDSGTEVAFGLPDDLQGKLVALVVVLRRHDVNDVRVIDVSSGQPTIR
jgi:cell division protein FtsQ